VALTRLAQEQLGPPVNQAVLDLRRGAMTKRRRSAGCCETLGDSPACNAALRSRSCIHMLCRWAHLHGGGLQAHVQQLHEAGRVHAAASTAAAPPGSVPCPPGSQQASKHSSRMMGSCRQPVVCTLGGPAHAPPGGWHPAAGGNSLAHAPAADEAHFLGPRQPLRRILPPRLRPRGLPVQLDVVQRLLTQAGGCSLQPACGGGRCDQGLQCEARR